VRLALVTGFCVPGECGVGDYTVCLHKHLESSGVEAHIINSREWDLLGGLKAGRNFQRDSFDLVHIQYPTAGFGARLGPQALSLRRTCIVTIHEASQRHILRKLALLPFVIRSRYIIFTSRIERQFSLRWMPWISDRSSVIPVGSNIPMGKKVHSRRLDEIVYFGLIVPRRGVEQVLELGRLIGKTRVGLRVRIVGRVSSKHVDYVKRLREESSQLPIDWSLDLSEEQVAMKLAQTSITYLPYPDGASERRTTLRAALLNGTAVVTTRDIHTQPSLEGIVKFAPTPSEALSAVLYLLNHRDEMSTMSSAAMKHAQQYDWPHIAECHLHLYQQLLSPKVAREQIPSHVA
jgi:glycosyltransferase involved in cell wall biosynthesis